MPLPFKRVLQQTTPAMTGSDVVIMQNLLIRSPYVKDSLVLDGIFGSGSRDAVYQFQNGNRMSNCSGVLDAPTADLLLKLHSADGYKDNGVMLPGAKYKVYVPVKRDRSIELNATLFDANHRVLHSFIARSRGQLHTDGSALNELSGNGATPTGLMWFDLNSEEEPMADYGPYPINRAVEGIQGNAAIHWSNAQSSGTFISNIRNGILMHTGEWPGWKPPMPMPDSHGCVHAYPEDIRIVWKQLVAIGVEVHENTNGAMPYPYIPQGLLSVELVD